MMVINRRSPASYSYYALPCRTGRWSTTASSFPGGGSMTPPSSSSEAHVEDAAAADGGAASFPETVVAAAAGGGGLLLLLAIGVRAAVLGRRVRRRWRDVGLLLAWRWVRGGGRRRVACLVAHGRWMDGWWMDQQLADGAGLVPSRQPSRAGGGGLKKVIVIYRGRRGLESVVDVD